MRRRRGRPYFFSHHAPPESHRSTTHRIAIRARARTHACMHTQAALTRADEVSDAAEASQGDGLAVAARVAVMLVALEALRSAVVAAIASLVATAAKIYASLSTLTSLSLLGGGSAAGGETDALLPGTEHEHMSIVRDSGSGLTMAHFLLALAALYYVATSLSGARGVHRASAAVRAGRRRGRGRGVGGREDRRRRQRESDAAAAAAATAARDDSDSSESDDDENRGYINGSHAAFTPLQSFLRRCSGLWGRTPGKK